MVIIVGVINLFGYDEYIYGVLIVYLRRGLGVVMGVKFDVVYYGGFLL